MPNSPPAAAHLSNATIGASSVLEVSVRGDGSASWQQSGVLGGWQGFKRFEMTGPELALESEAHLLTNRATSFDPGIQVGTRSTAAGWRNCSSAYFSSEREFLFGTDEQGPTSLERRDCPGQSQDRLAALVFLAMLVGGSVVTNMPTADRPDRSRLQPDVGKDDETNY
jgi:hypothetical protein